MPYQSENGSREWDQNRSDFIKEAGRIWNEFRERLNLNLDTIRVGFFVEKNKLSNEVLDKMGLSSQALENFDKEKMEKEGVKILQWGQEGLKLVVSDELGRVVASFVYGKGKKGWEVTEIGRVIYGDWFELENAIGVEIKMNPNLEVMGEYVYLIPSADDFSVGFGLRNWVYGREMIGTRSEQLQMVTLHSKVKCNS